MSEREEESAPDRGLVLRGVIPGRGKHGPAGRRSLPMWIAAAFVLGLLGADPVSRASPVELPAFVTAWECTGEFAPGAEWTGAGIEVREERIRFVEIVIRFGPAALPDAEAVWFERPSVPRVTSLVAWEQFCRDECRDELLRDLFGEGVDPVIDRVTAGRRCREQRVGEADGVTKPQIALEVVSLDFRAGRSGIIVNPRVDLGSLICEDERHAGQTPDKAVWISEDYDLDGGSVETSDGHGQARRGEASVAMRDAGAAMLDRLLDLLVARRPDPGSFVTGLPAVRLARHEIRNFAALCREQGHEAEGRPRDYPGELSLAAAVLPRADLASMAAIDLRFYDPSRGWDDEASLRLLGDAPAPRQRDAILEILDSSIAANDTVSASLALRALLAADPDAARRRARTLLEHDELWRSACGVFVLSDPALARRYGGRDEITLEVRDDIVEALAGGETPR